MGLHIKFVFAYCIKLRNKMKKKRFKLICLHFYDVIKIVYDLSIIFSDSVIFEYKVL